MYVEEDMKYISLPIDSKYTINFCAFDSGTMQYIVESVYSSSNTAIQVKVFENVALSPGKRMYSQVGSNVDTHETKLYLIDSGGISIKEINTDGTETPIHSQMLLGNVSGSGTINMQDVLLIYQKYRGKITMSPEQMIAADVNRDGAVNMQDVLLVYQYYRGKITEF
jgi:hypothetical protein